MSLKGRLANDGVHPPAASRPRVMHGVMTQGVLCP